MIEINLLPAEQRIKTKKVSVTAEAQNKIIVYAVMLVVILLACLNLYVITRNTGAALKLKSLSSQWSGFEQKRKSIEAFQKESSELLGSDKAMQQVVTARVVWSEKMNKLSLDLSYGVWFNELTVNRKELIIKGSILSLDKQEMGLLNKFIDDLKKDQQFSRDFEKLDISSLQRKQIGGYEIADFVFTAKLKTK
ncbi:MAG: hypothetical protein NTY47_02610 [Candidatus Omnitrophica bacterium]|nr:hypothetical protein [Candidatus Omnitrophota bacterium]